MARLAWQNMLQKCHQWSKESKEQPTNALADMTKNLKIERQFHASSSNSSCTNLSMASVIFVTPSSYKPAVTPPRQTKLALLKYQCSKKPETFVYSKIPRHLKLAVENLIEEDFMKRSGLGNNQGKLRERNWRNSRDICTTRAMVMCYNSGKMSHCYCKEMPSIVKRYHQILMKIIGLRLCQLHNQLIPNSFCFHHQTIWHWSSVPICGYNNFESSWGAYEKQVKGANYLQLHSCLASS